MTDRLFLKNRKLLSQATQDKIIPDEWYYLGNSKVSINKEATKEEKQELSSICICSKYISDIYYYVNIKTGETMAVGGGCKQKFKLVQDNPKTKKNKRKELITNLVKDCENISNTKYVKLGTKKINNILKYSDKILNEILIYTEEQVEIANNHNDKAYDILVYCKYILACLKASLINHRNKNKDKILKKSTYLVNQNLLEYIKKNIHKYNERQYMLKYFNKSIPYDNIKIIREELNKKIWEIYFEYYPKKSTNKNHPTNCNKINFNSWAFID